MAEADGMEISGASGEVNARYAIRVEKIAQDQQKAEGEAAVALIADAAPVVPTPSGPDGQGSRVNRYA